ncbi:MAG TPA: glycosyltransferase, partial [Verrucomicrobiae bacterium]|nr:glycosyltransferase [Verrucomicrobiae bacterium]
MKEPSHVVHVTSWLSRRGGGIPPVIQALARESRHRGFEVSVLGLDDPWVKEDFAADGVAVAADGVVGPAAFGFSPGLRRRLEGWRGQVIHSHGLWMYPGVAARQAAIQHGCRLVISPHGMLEPWATRHSGWKKRLAGRFFENKNLRRADCLHALCRAEAENFRGYGLKNPVAVIPNGVRIEDFSAPADDRALRKKFPALDGRRRILFLSRLHPKKGIVELLQAWRRMARDFAGWQLVVAGGGDVRFEEQLKTVAGPQNSSVVFTGPLFGETKRQILAGADVFALPSFSEGFSVAVLEAAASGLPVLLTRECNFPELAGAGAAVEIAPAP